MKKYVLSRSNADKLRVDVSLEMRAIAVELQNPEREKSRLFRNQDKYFAQLGKRMNEVKGGNPYLKNMMIDLTKGDWSVEAFIAFA